MAARKDDKGRALRKGEFQRASDGKYVYGYVDPYGIRRYIYSKDLKKLREREEKLIKNQLDGLDVYTAGNAELNRIFDRYMSTKTELRDTTLANYNYMYDTYVRDGFGKKKIGSIKYSDVLQFYHDLYSKKGLKIATIENIHTLLHPTFRMAVRDEIIRLNPTDDVMSDFKKKNSHGKDKRIALTVEQQRAFMTYIANSPVFVDWLPLFTVFLGTGCRVGEIIGLRWEDVDFKKKVISINHAFVYHKRRRGDEEACEFKVSLPKTNAGIRTVPMMEQVYIALKDEYERQKVEGFSDAVVDGMTGFIFTNRYHTIFNPASINHIIKRIYEAYNAEEKLNAEKEGREPVLIPHFSCHNLRHTFCTRFCENENNVKAIQAIMGHANIETTMDIYTDVTEKTKEDVMKNLSKQVDLF